MRYELQLHTKCCEYILLPDTSSDHLKLVDIQAGYRKFFATLPPYRHRTNTVCNNTQVLSVIIDLVLRDES